MPELPEVETIVRGLAQKVVGKKITGFWSDWEKTIKQVGGIKMLTKAVKGRKIIKAERRAKYVILKLTGNKNLFVHQKISGHLMYGKWVKNVKHKAESEKEKIQTWVSITPGPLKDDPKNGYIRAIFFLDNGYQLALSDLRRFAKIILTDDDEIGGIDALKGLGPEPLEMDFKEFVKLFANKKGRLKPVLMDPKFIAGIGNIYADEILWDVGFHPLSRVQNLKEADLRKLFNSMKKVLKKAIKYQGDSIEDFRKLSGEKGKYQEIQKAYQQTGKKCAKKDGGVITRIKIGQRSAHFCPVHQRKI